jgi:hypothetical protein
MQQKSPSHLDRKIHHREMALWTGRIHGLTLLHLSAGETLEYQCTTDLAAFPSPSASIIAEKQSRPCLDPQSLHHIFPLPTLSPSASTCTANPSRFL